MKKKILGLILILLVLFTTGCGDVQIFRSNEVTPVMVPVEVKDMEMDTFYVKDGTRFYKPMTPTGSAINMPDNISQSRVMGVTPEYREGYPTHYGNEIIAYTTQDLKGLSHVTLERFKDLGYSIGAYNGVWSSEDNSIKFNIKNNVFKDTAFSADAGSLESPELKIVAINGEPLSTANVDVQAGVIVGLEKDKAYTFTLYSGTFYHEIETVADCHMFSSFELYNFGEEYMSLTQNGYMEFNTPKQLKAGYYIVNGQGFFRYLPTLKGEKEPVNMNEEYYQSEKERLAAYSRQYSVNVPKQTKNMSIDITYSVTDNTEPQGIVFSPDGTRYDMVLDSINRRLSLTLAEAKAGEWTVNITPSSVVIADVNVTDSSLLQDLTQETYHVDIENEMQGAIIKIPYRLLNGVEQDPVINGNVLTPEGDTVILEAGVNEKIKEETEDGEPKHFLSATLYYASPGEYEITVNHYPSMSEIQEPEVKKGIEAETDTITIEE